MSTTVPGGAPTTATELAAVTGAPAGRPRDLLRALLRRPTFVLSVLVLAWWLFWAIAWRLVGVEPFDRTGDLMAVPSAAHLFGTDDLGRDVFARTVAGARPALLVGPFGAGFATVLGGFLGLVAGYFRGWVDTALMRFFDVLLALPTLIFLVVLVGAFGTSTTALVAIVTLLFAPGIARIVRAAVLVEMGKDYVTSARVQGESHLRVLRTELLPNVAPLLLVQALLSLGAAVLVTSSLSFLGLGAQPPSPDWGLAINEKRVLLQAAWWTVAAPALAVASLVVAANVVADHVSEISTGNTR